MAPTPRAERRPLLGKRVLAADAAPGAAAAQDETTGDAMSVIDRAGRHGYGLSRVSLEALGQAWDGWEVEGITPPAAFISDAGLLAWLDTLDRGRPVEVAAPKQLEMEWAA